MGVPYASVRMPIPPTKSPFTFFLVLLLHLLKCIFARFFSTSDPPPNRPSIVEIVNETLPATMYSVLVQGREEEEDAPVCSVCLCHVATTHMVRELPNCRHVFHSACIDRWVRTGQLICPLCRALLLNFSSHTD